MEYNKTCRLCTRMGDNFFDLFKQTEFIRIVDKCFDIHISDEDLYHYLCTRCNDKLKDLTKFTKEIVEAQKYFEDLSNIVVIQVKPEECFPEEVAECEPEPEIPVVAISDTIPALDDEPPIPVNDYPLLQEIKTEVAEEEMPPTTVQSVVLASEESVAIKTEPMEVADQFIKTEIFEEPVMNSFSHENQMEDLGQLAVNDMSNTITDASQLYELLNDDEHETVEPEIVCPQCERVFRDTYSYEQHQLTHLSSEQREQYKVQCEYCKKFYMGDDFLAAHIKDHHSNKENPVSCGECGQVCRNLESLHRHHKAKHTAPTMMNCPDCGEEVRVYYYDRHRRAKHVEKPPAICSICSKAFKNRHHLLNHQYRVHTEPKFGCEICGRLFKTKSHLKKHHNSHVFQQNDTDIVVCQESLEVKVEMEGPQ